MKQEIIDAILAGRPVREIAASIIPRVSHMALQRFRAKHVAPALQHAMTNSKSLARSPIQRALRQEPDSAKVIESARAEIQHGPVLAVRQKRLAWLQDRHDRLNLIVEERAADMAAIPGGKSGLLAKDFKSDGREVYKVDGVLLSELREHEKQVAVELGEWQEHNIPGVMVQIVLPVATCSEPHEPECIDIALPARLLR
jgi:hypothetical protein